MDLDFYLILEQQLVFVGFDMLCPKKKCGVQIVNMISHVFLYYFVILSILTGRCSGGDEAFL